MHTQRAAWLDEDTPLFERMRRRGTRRRRHRHHTRHPAARRVTLARLLRR